jgi:hypothetical protein
MLQMNVNKYVEYLAGSYYLTGILRREPPNYNTHGTRPYHDSRVLR